MDLSTPLSDDEYNDLHDFLMSDVTGEDGMDISMLDGFLTAIVSGPQMIAPSEWIHLVWGKKEMAWRTTGQAEHYLSLILRQMNTLIDVLMNAPEAFEPITYTEEQEDKSVSIIDDWCAGYIMGINQDFDGWRPLIDSQESQHLLATIFLYGTENGAKQLLENPEIATQHAEFVASLPESTTAIYQYWEPARKALAKQKTFRKPLAEPGRNDPCPCGSGKKYKKCCATE
jgi:uncharacterized protein